MLRGLRRAGGWRASGNKFQRKDAKDAKKVFDTRRRGDAEQIEIRAIDPMPSEDRPLPTLPRDYFAGESLPRT
jgi:hypothetical protein